MTGPERSFQLALLEQVAAFLEPVTSAAVNPARRRRLLDDLGWDLAAVAGLDQAAFEEWADDVARAVDAVVTLVESGGPGSLEDLRTMLPAAEAAVGVAAGLPPALTGNLPAELPVEALASDLLTHLVVTTLSRGSGLAFHLAALLGLVTPAEDTEVSEPVPSTGAAIRLARRRPELHLERLPDLLTDPVGLLEELYFPLGWSTAAEVDLAARLLFTRLAGLLETTGIRATYGLKPSLGPDLGPYGLALAGHMLNLSARVPIGPALATLGASIGLSSPDRGGLGLVVVPRGRLQFGTVAGGWGLRFALEGSGAAFSFGRDGLVVQGGGENLGLEVEAVKVPDAAGFAFLVGSTTGTRLQVGNLVLGAFGRLGAGRDDFGLSAAAESAALVVAGGDGDGFLQRILPPEGLRIAFELGAAWSRRAGLTLKGGAGLEATLPVHVALGPLHVPSVFLRARAAQDGLALALAATADVELGPVHATVERMGLEATLTFPPGGGNLGPASLDLAFKPPEGAGLKVEAGPLVGGGYLFFDHVNRQYAGVLQLEFKGIALKAVGIITTRLPDGTDGFSLLVIISAEFTPIQLGYGFTLSGVGGLVGVNRTAAVEVLRAGIKSRTLDSIMFPRDPVANAPQLISNLSAAFPPAAGRFVVGPMARLGWGTPTLLTLDLGLLLELPAPVRLVVLGRLRVALPRPEAAVVSINMDVIGIVDFQRGQVSIDATIYDSTVAGFALTGDMALRAGWGDRPGFALAAGGFHPRFQPPPGFPALERLALTLSTGDNPRLRLESYFALTANTVQFGARLDLYAAALGFSISGTLVFDALFQLDPLSVLIEISGTVALKKGSRQLGGVTVTLTLTGPAPWHARGRARVEVLFLSAEVSFDVRLGRAAPPELPEPVDVEELVDGALADPRNWSAQLPPDGESVVSLRELVPADGELLVHPLATVAFTQRVAPLGRPLERFGAARIRGSTQMDITLLQVGGVDATAVAVQEHFAPAQFLDLSDDEKLARPSFERWDAGRRLAARTVSFDTAPPLESPLTPETVIIDDPDRP
ncbi:MAG TPA: DUF6603 domain-containing protein, partial [Acidimicrobiales bacterium]|nr:DUF6603 domain-containing protein [Acidimicrobiales bacterium]